MQQVAVSIKSHQNHTEPIDRLWRRCCRSYQIAANSYSMTSRMLVELGSNKYRTFMWRSNDCCRHFHLAHSPSEPRKEAKAARGLDCRQPLSLLYPSSLRESAAASRNQVITGPWHSPLRYKSSRVLAKHQNASIQTVTQIHKRHHALFIPFINLPTN